MSLKTSFKCSDFTVDKRDLKILRVDCMSMLLACVEMKGIVLLEIGCGRTYRFSDLPT